jgi:nucleoside-diphosphate-sugar epimerase
LSRIAITGSRGTIGGVLRSGLKDFEIVEIDLPEDDVRDLPALTTRIEGCHALVHLAWDLKTDNWDTGRINPDNALMTYNAYQSCIDAKVPRIIVASSVNADDFFAWTGEGRMNPSTLPTPTSPYGANKVMMEAMGRYYARKGLEVICVRFGAVNKDNRPTTEGWDWRRVWLSHDDCVSLVRACLTVPKVPGNYALVYGVSDNSGGIHDWSNPFGWVPNDDAYLQR